jgi:hypothetical protein
VVDFSQLKVLEQSGTKTVPYKLEQIEGAPTIFFLPGTDANKPFMNESLRLANMRSKRSRRGMKVTQETLRQSRDEDRDILSRLCAKDWKDVVDASGEAVPFTSDNCREFFEQLPDWLFDDIRGWVTDPTNFIADNDGTELGEA